jgi:hypothetical protein
MVRRPGNDPCSQRCGWKLEFLEIQAMAKIWKFSEFTVLLHCRKPVATRKTPAYLMADRTFCLMTRRTNMLVLLGKTPIDADG